MEGGREEGREGGREGGKGGQGGQGSRTTGRLAIGKNGAIKPLQDRRDNRSANRLVHVAGAGVLREDLIIRKEAEARVAIRQWVTIRSRQGDRIMSRQAPPQRPLALELLFAAHGPGADGDADAFFVAGRARAPHGRGRHGVAWGLVGVCLLCC